ncbi:MAG: NAD(P)-dependent oxidoreductase [Tepidisphaeraceae bacterium]
MRHWREHDVYLTGWTTVTLPPSLAQDPGKLRYICGVTGSMKTLVPIELVRAGIPLTNWGDAPANGVAEGAMTLLLTVLKDIPKRTTLVREGGWKLDMDQHGGSLLGLNVGIYGCGVIGRRFVEMIRPFGAKLRVFDPYASTLPEGVDRANSLDELMAGTEALVIHAGWTPETNKSITRKHLAMLPDHGVVINTARGGIIDQDALFDELASGRLRAGLDVLEPDKMPTDHAARQWSNVVFTAHQVEFAWPGASRRMSTMHEYALDNLRRFASGQPLRWLMDETRYKLST